MKDNLIVNLSFEFGLAIILFCDKLVGMKKFVLADQLLRSGLSIGANIREAQNAESKADFIHKMKIAAKEGDEAEYFLELIKKAYNLEGIDELILKLESINRVLGKIIASSKSA